MRNLCTDQRGASAVEFAFVAPVLIALAFGGIEFGSIFYTYASAEFATNDVARQLATNRINQSQAKAAIPPRLPTWAQTAATVAVSASSATPTSNFYTVTTSVPLVNATPSIFFKSIYGTRKISVTAVMQQEPTS
jgi:Flp pilus assembly protein TadG